LIPTCLYYLSLLIMVELDARKYGARDVDFTPEMSLGTMTRRYGFHFISLLAVVFFMVIGYSPALSSPPSAWLAGAWCGWRCFI
jgi:TRAP-type uncharacterized transport system fused permease subunit